ncbi:MAG: gamma-glutamyltransferase [Gammaproteobacteria bacterium]
MIKHVAIKLLLLVAVAVIAIPVEVFPAQEQPRQGIASAHPLATAAGYEILSQGGNAFDAAVAVSAVLTVVEPFSSGLGGGGFYLLHRAKDGLQIMVDGRETAPAAATADMYLNENGDVDRSRVREGALAAAIPGTPAALAHMAEKYGNLSLSESLQPAIRLARDGFTMDRRFAGMIATYEARLKRHCEPGCPFLVNGEPVQAGAYFRQPELARSLQRIADKGVSEFYSGALAEKMVAEIRKRGGIWTLADLRSYRVKERVPATGKFHGLSIVTAAPPSSGGVILIEVLNILSGYNLATLDDITRRHVIVEAFRRAYRDRNEYMGDPGFVSMPLDMLMHTQYAAGLRATIRLDRATPSYILPPVVPLHEGNDTSHFSIIDSAGNRVAATQTINLRFGSGIVPPGTGITLNDEMDDFTAKLGEPNTFGLVQGRANMVQPGKRPLSSSSPTFVESDRGVAVLGTPGGSRIISMVVLAILDYVDGGNAKSMAAVPRFHHQFVPDQIQYEPGALDAEMVSRLEAMGHTTRVLSRRYGNMNVVTWERETGLVETSTDPRNEVLVDF